MKRWVVRQGEGEDVAAIVARAGGDARALAEGRVFIGRRRATASDVVAPGDEVTIAPPASAGEAAAGDAVVILARDGDVVAVDKPAGIPTIADHGGASYALVARVAAALKVPEDRVHPTSRLDRDVSGVVVFALSKEARDRLVRAREEGTYARRYVAIATCAPEPASGSWDAPIGRAKDARHRAAFGRDATPARSDYAVVARSGAFALIALGPVTGRTHQLRVHAAHAGAPLLGDRTYGSAASATATARSRGGASSLVLPTGKVVALTRIALHAARVTIPRRDGSPWALRAPIPVDLAELWGLLGGDPSAWDMALSCPLPSP